MGARSRAVGTGPGGRDRFSRKQEQARMSVLQLELPEAVISAIAQRAAAILAEDDSGFLNIDGAAAFLGGCGRKRIYNLVERGGLPHYKAGGRLLFDPARLRAWVEASR